MSCSIARGEHCYLADFGLTQSASEGGPADGQLMGTIDYVSPEQIRGDPIDGRADQYGLACLMFKCLTGTVPYEQRSDLAALFAHLEEVPRASERAPDLPEELDPVLAKGMAQSPGDRFGSCTALVTAVREALGLAPAASSSRRLLALLGALIVVAGVAIALARSLGGGGGEAAAATGSLVRVNPATNEVTARYRVSAHPGAITTGAGRVWLGDYRDGALWTLEPSTGELRRVTSLGEPRDLTALGGKIYVASDSAEVFPARLPATTRSPGCVSASWICTACTSPEERASSGRWDPRTRSSTEPGDLRILHSDQLSRTVNRSR